MQRKLKLWTILVVCVLQFSTRPVVAQVDADKDHSFVLEIGSAGERSLNESSSQFGGTVAVETTPVENWLELESGVTALKASDHTELGLDLLFKKPYRLSRTAEFMFGLGPEVVHDFGGSDHTTSYDMEIILDFMSWPTANVGWYVEPGYSSSFGERSMQSLEVSAGIIIGFE
jgi:hypothetical protein